MLKAVGKQEKDLVIMPTLLIKVSHSGWAPTVKATALLDTGASRSFVTKGFCEKLHLNSFKQVGSYHVQGINGSTSTKHTAHMILHGDKADVFEMPLDALVLAQIGRVQGANLKLDKQLALECADVFPTKERDIDILLGNDCLWHILKAGSIEIEKGIVVISTSFGKVLSGFRSKHQINHLAIANLAFHLLHPEGELEGSPEHGIALIAVSNGDEGAGIDKELLKSADKLMSTKNPADSDNNLMELEARMIRYLGYESLGAEPYCAEMDIKAGDVAALQNFNDSIKFENGKYEVGLTFNPNAQPLLNNRNAAVAMLRKCEEKLAMKPAIRSQYIDAIETYKKEGDIELCSSTPIEGRVFYLPHHEVMKEGSSTSKCRIVFNGSAKGKNGVSLNNCLLPGPQGVNDLVKILINFRWRKVAVSGDVRRMYLAISIREEDRDFLRFLWRSNPNGEIEEWRFKKVAFGIADSSFTSQQVLKLHAEKYKEKYPEIVRSIIEDRWVDDLLNSVDSEQEATQYISTICKIMAEGGFQLKKWVSSSKNVMKTIPQEDRLDANEPFTFSEFDEESVKALGVKISLATDTVGFDGNDELPEIITKTTVASKVAGIFDPLGLLLPFTITGKRIMQRIWEEEKLAREKDKADGLSTNEINRKRKRSWKEPVSDEIATEFKAWVQQIPQLKNFSTPRAVIDVNKTIVGQQLHMCSDASLQAYSAGVWVRTLYDDSSITLRLLVAKSRVAPSTLVTMPRQELMGALLGANLMEKVVDALKWKDMNALHYWTDSACVLAWIKGDPQGFKMWVSNRLIQLHQKAPKAPTQKIANWKHIRGTDNPADCPTRGITAEQLCKSKLWLHGPDWMSRPENEWPVEDINLGDQDHLLEKALAMTAKASLEDPFLTVANRVNDLQAVYRIVDLFSRCRPKRMGGMIVSSFSSRRRARERVLKRFQLLSYSEEITALKAGQQIDKASSLKHVAPFIDDDGFLRAQGRFQSPDRDEFPAIIAHDSRLTTLLIWDRHTRHDHAGPEWTLAKLRAVFWFIKARRTVKAIINRCISCQKVKNKLCTQIMAPLPSFRQSAAPVAFRYTGVDFAGPFLARNGQTTEYSKYWIALFTCMQIRAVHLELVRDMSTETFLLAFRKFIARRVKPYVVYSDNGKTFTKAAKDIAKLHRVWNAQKVKNFCDKQEIDWKFNVPSAPWWGATWERLVKTVKSSLKFSLNKADLTEDQLATFMVEAESFANSRPLTDVSDSPEDPLPVSPAMLLYGMDPHNEVMARVGQAEESVKISKLWKDRVATHKKYVNRFRTDYISSLMPRKKWLEENNKLPKIDDVVLIEEPTKRDLWPLARIVDLVEGRDGKIRSAVLKTSKGVLKRPIQRIVPLEATEDPLPKSSH